MTNYIQFKDKVSACKREKQEVLNESNNYWD